ncbi:hypothetical protein ACFVH7_20405 [Kitasatospora indigofera]|uniref:hypothetical protein n=1 Tax=Kitasatospora indigofera TaxID=67307 RepID=UPI0036425794
MSDESADERTYARADGLEGLLQRGRGLGALLAARDPEGAAELVYGCVRYDWRWDSVDERHLYLARLIRDLDLPPGPVVALLTLDEDACDRATRVLELLAKSGSLEAREALRAHVREGEHWLAVLESVADCWPAAWWRDLADVARARIDGDERLRGDPEARETLRSLLGPAAVPHPSRRVSRLEVTPTSGTLLTLLADPGAREDAKVRALRLLACRPPEPGLLALVPSLSNTDGQFPLPGLARAVARCGSLAVPAARTWVEDGRNWLVRLGLEILAEHGDAADIPVLTAHLTADLEQGSWCGPKVLAAGLARFGPQAAEAVPLLRRYWLHTPHSYERPAYLGALAAIDPGGLEYAYTESLWDCEADARMLGIAGAPDLPQVRDRLAQLRDDPLETPEARRAAAARLGRPARPAAVRCVNGTAGG